MKHRLEIRSVYKHLALFVVSIAGIFGLFFSFGSNVATENSAQRLSYVIQPGDSCIDYEIAKTNQGSNTDIFINCGGFLP